MAQLRTRRRRGGEVEHDTEQGYEAGDDTAANEGAADHEARRNSRLSLRMAP